MRATVYTTVLCLSLIMGGCSIPSNCQTNKIETMKNVKFIPKEFNDIKLGFRESIQNVCSPQFSGLIPVNSITINSPQKIICKNNKNVYVPIIPVCVVYDVSLRRGLKYYHLNVELLHIRRIGDEKIYTGEIFEKGLENEYPDYPSGYYEELERIEADVKEAQKYSDDDLDSGQSSGGYMNIDLLEYVDVPLQSGLYEIYLSFSGLESNHVQVEIVFEE